MLDRKICNPDHPAAPGAAQRIAQRLGDRLGQVLQHGALASLDLDRRGHAGLDADVRIGPGAQAPPLCAYLYAVVGLLALAQSFAQSVGVDVGELAAQVAIDRVSQASILTLAGRPLPPSLISNSSTWDAPGSSGRAFVPALHRHETAHPSEKPVVCKTSTGFESASGAGCRIRTDDLPLTRRVLYQLS